MDRRKVEKHLIAPPLGFAIALIPISATFLFYAMRNLPEKSAVRISSYLLAFYTLCIWCVRIPKLIRISRSFRQKNKYARLWSENTRLRVNVNLLWSVLWNTAYGLFQLVLGIYHRSWWYYSLAGYYGSLAIMRFFLVRHSTRHQPGEKMRDELLRYRICGWVFLLTNLALTGMIAYLVFENRTVRHHEITTIAMAAFSFTAFTVAIVNVFRYRKYGSPVYSASKAISLASASVSMLTLENTMLQTFRGELGENERKIFLGLSGGVLALFILAMAVYMIGSSNRKLKELEKANG